MTTTGQLVIINLSPKESATGSTLAQGAEDRLGKYKGTGRDEKAELEESRGGLLGALTFLILDQGEDIIALEFLPTIQESELYQESNAGNFTPHLLH